MSYYPSTLFSSSPSTSSSRHSSAPSTSTTTSMRKSRSSTSSKMMTRSTSTLVTSSLLLLSSLVGCTLAQDTPQETLALYEPPDGQVMFGAWVQTEEGDTPAAMNARLGYNSSVIQIAQSIPLQPYDWVTGAGGGAPEELIERTETDAAVFLTVYPYTGLEVLNITHYTDLGNQILNWTENYNRSVFLRWAPEMNGNWMPYGLQPLMFVEVWRTMYTVIKQIAPATAIVWAPNTGQGYPYSMPLPQNATEATALDTSGDGQLSPLDSPFSPYYPGDEYVDWVGLSVYYKGPNSQNINVAQPSGYCYGALRNNNPNNGVDTADPWYENYCVGRNKACMFAESGPAYHDMIFGDQGIPDAALKRAWIDDCLTNVTLFQEHPRLKMMMHFEYEKNETDSGIDDHRDFRITNKTDVLQEFQAALATMSGEVYTWANYRPIPVSTPNVVTQTNLVTTTDANGNTVVETSKVTTSTFSFITVRNTQTGFPSLFGDYYSSAARAVIISCAMFASTIGVLLGGTVFLMRV